MNWRIFALQRPKLRASNTPAAGGDRRSLLSFFYIGMWKVEKQSRGLPGLNSASDSGKAENNREPIKELSPFYLICPLLRKIYNKTI